MAQTILMMMRLIGGMKKVRGNGSTPRKPTHMVFVHYKAHMA